MYWLLAIVALGFLIVVHEGGHYFVARWCGMRIERFSIGFGPGILKRTSKKTGTIFQIAPIPFGGFVEIRGMAIAEDVDPDDKFAYPNRPAWQRFITIFAGPATNYLSAIFLAFALYTCHGVDVPHWYAVGELMEGYDSAGKVKPGDRIVEVDHLPLFIDSGRSLVQRVNDGKGAPVTLTIERGGVRSQVTIKPRADKDDKGDTVWRLGIKPEAQYIVVEVGVLDAAVGALEYPIETTKAIGAGIYGILFKSEKADPGGPKRMVDEFRKAFEAGFVRGIKLVMLLSVYLGLFNLFPLPALDGGRLVFLGYELVTRRRANPKIEAMVHMAGIMVLMVVMVLVTMRDFHAFGWGT
jgi:regulator of sigma E protease